MCQDLRVAQLQHQQLCGQTTVNAHEVIRLNPKRPSPSLRGLYAACVQLSRKA